MINKITFSYNVKLLTHNACHLWQQQMNTNYSIHMSVFDDLIKYVLFQNTFHKNGAVDSY